MRTRSILAMVAALASNPLAAQCVAANFSATALRSLTGASVNYAVQSDTGAALRTICGLQFRCKARGTTPVATSFSIWSATKAGVPGAMLRTGKVTVGPAVAVYGVTFAPLNLAASTRFFCVIDNSTGGGLTLPIAPAGTNQTHFLGGPPSWTGPFTAVAWNYNVVCCAASGNTRYIPDSAATGGCNLIPFGTSTTSSLWSNQRYQSMATSADLGSPTSPIRICNLGFLSCGTAKDDNISHSDTIEIRLAQTNATSLAAAFATNLAANVQTVLKRQDFDWHQRSGIWERIGLDDSYTFDPALGRNLVIDICVTGGRKLLGATTGFHTGSRQRLFNIGWATSGGCPATGTLDPDALKWCVDIHAWSFSHQGVGCQKLDLRLSGSGELGKVVSMTTTGVPTTAKCFIAIGEQSLSPGFDLAAIGAKGCSIYCLPLVTAPGPLLRGTIPRDTALICQRFRIQSYCLDSSFPGGIATSNEALLVTGLGQ